LHNNKITVFDESNAEIGQTYPRRAKQLVTKGRAVWQDDRQRAIRMTPKEADKETMKMEHDFIDNEELMQTAKSNVRLKRSLICHLIAFLIAAPLIFAFFDGFMVSSVGRYTYTAVENHTIVSSLRELNTMAFQFSHVGDTAASAIIAQATSDLVNSFSLADLEQMGSQVITHATPTFDAVWYFVWGAYFAWGVFILSRLVVYFLPKIRHREQRQVSAEYSRLKTNAPVVISTRENA